MSERIFDTNYEAVAHDPRVARQAGGLCTIEAIFDDMNAAQEARLLMPGTAELSLPSEDQDTIRLIGAHGVELAGIRYGYGPADFTFGPQRIVEQHDARNRTLLWYNTATHNQKVGFDGMRLGERRGLGSLACHGMATGGDWHDADQTAAINNPNNRDGSDELHSAQELIEVLRHHNVRKDAAYWAAYFITGTQVVLENGVVVGQYGATVERDELPTDEAWLACRIGANADLSRVYDDFDVSFGLFPQRLGLSYPDKPNLHDETTRQGLRDFIKGQVGFFTNFKFSLPEAEELFATNREPAIKHMEELLETSDDIPTGWDEFMEQQRAKAATMRAAQNG